MPAKVTKASALPEVHTTRSGVQYVRAADLLLSEKGQAELQRLANSAFYRRAFQRGEPQNHTVVTKP